MLLGKIVQEAAQDPRIALGVAGITISSGTLAILEVGIGWISAILGIILAIVLIRNHIKYHPIKMKILENELAESEARKKARLKK